MNSSAIHSISDLGEKIGGARKDLASRSRSSSARVKDERPTWARRFLVMVAIDGKWSVTDVKGVLRIRASYETREQAERAIPIHALSLAHHHHVRLCEEGGVKKFEIRRKIGDRSSVRIVNQTFNAEVDALTYMAANAADILNINTTFGEADLPLPEKVVRHGIQWRRDDQHVEGEDFIQTFGFRGVEFGNWNNQAERQAFMDIAYDSLADLAHVLGIDPKDISLGGELALAFGARGAGLSSARAHYEPQRCVINLTKMKSAGALAHEWFHALDHFAARRLGLSVAQMSLQNDGTRMFVPGRFEASFFATNIYLQAFEAVQPRADHPSSQVARSISQFFGAMHRKPQTYTHELGVSKKFVEETLDEIVSRLSQIRQELAVQCTWKKRLNQPASAQNLAEFDAAVKDLIDQQRSWIDQSLADQPTVFGMAQTLPLNRPIVERISAVIQLVRGRSGFVADGRGELDRLNQSLTIQARRISVLGEARTGRDQVRSISTEFVMSAVSIDQGRGEAYWKQPTELGARSFMAILRDQMDRMGMVNTYLNYAPKGWVLPTPWGWIPIFPQGEELTRIEKSFDEVQNQLKAHGLLHRAQNSISDLNSPEQEQEQEQDAECVPS